MYVLFYPLAIYYSHIFFKKPLLSFNIFPYSRHDAATNISMYCNTQSLINFRIDASQKKISRKRYFSIFYENVYLDSNYRFLFSGYLKDEQSSTFPLSPIAFLTTAALCVLCVSSLMHGSIHPEAVH